MGKKDIRKAENEKKTKRKRRKGGEREGEKEMERKVQELEGAYVCMRERESRTF